MSLSLTVIQQSFQIYINKWFPVDEYGRASGICNLYIIGSLLGYGITAFYFWNEKADFVKDLNDLILYFNYAGTIFFLFF